MIVEAGLAGPKSVGQARTLRHRVKLLSTGRITSFLRKASVLLSRNFD